MARRNKHPLARKRGIASTSSPGPSSTPGTSIGPRKRAASPRAAPDATGRKKARHFRRGTVALREIRHYQKSVNLLIPAAPFIRTVKEISGNLAPEISRWTAEAILVIQEAKLHLTNKFMVGKVGDSLELHDLHLSVRLGSRRFLVHLFEDAMLCSIHAKRVTLSKCNPCIVNVICCMQVPVKKDFELARRLGGKGQPW